LLCVGIEDVVGDTFVPAEHLNYANMAKFISEVGERNEGMNRMAILLQ
jgi:hypothetical protein